MIIMLLYENEYFVEKIEMRKNILKDLTVYLKERDFLAVVECTKVLYLAHNIFYYNYIHLYKQCFNANVLKY